MAIEMNVGEVMDRYSIVWLKKTRALDTLDHEELNLYANEVKSYDLRYPGLKIQLDRAAKKLLEFNGAIWDRESDLRQGRDKELGLEEVGRRAVEIRDINESRVATKNIINKLTKSGFREHKHTERDATDLEKQILEEVTNG